MSSDFERELKSILEGDPVTLDRICRSCNREEREGYMEVCSMPFIVIRAAGSFGVDLVAIRGEISLPIEVKSSVNDRLWLGKMKQMRQVERFRLQCRRSGVIPIYAFRLKRRKGDAWRLFTVPFFGHRELDLPPADVNEEVLHHFSGENDLLSGRMRMIYDVLPKARITPSGRIVLIWSEGMPLSKFLSYMASILSPPDHVEDHATRN